MGAAEVVIREATGADVVRIVELWEEFMDFHAALDPYFTRSADAAENFAKHAAEQIASETATVLVAEASQGLVGFCVARVSERPPVFEIAEFGSIGSLAVTERWRRKGVGEQLFGAAKRWFAERGIARIEVGVVTANELSSSFWREMGFRPYFQKLCLRIE